MSHLKIKQSNKNVRHIDKSVRRVGLERIRTKLYFRGMRIYVNWTNPFDLRRYLNASNTDKRTKYYAPKLDWIIMWQSNIVFFRVKIVSELTEGRFERNKPMNERTNDGPLNCGDCRRNYTHPYIYIYLQMVYD